jgi:hypothetical protein
LRVTKVSGLRNILTGLGLGAFVTLVAALVAIYLQVSSIVQTSNALLTSVEQSLTALAVDGKAMADSLFVAQSEIIALKRQLAELNVELEKLKTPSGTPQPKPQARSPRSAGVRSERTAISRT